MKVDAELIKKYRVSGSGIDENHHIGIDEVKVSRY